MPGLNASSWRHLWYAGLSQGVLPAICSDVGRRRVQPTLQDHLSGRVGLLEVLVRALAVH